MLFVFFILFTLFTPATVAHFFLFYLQSKLGELISEVQIRLGPNVTDDLTSARSSDKRVESMRESVRYCFELHVLFKGCFKGACLS